jgi:hypothetical protein
MILSQAVRSVERFRRQGVRSSRLGDSLVFSLLLVQVVLGFPGVAMAQQLDTDFGRGAGGHKSSVTVPKYTGSKPLPKPATTSNKPTPHRAASGVAAKMTSGSAVNEPVSMPGVALPGMGSESKPLSVTVSKTLYLPPEMYGQWSVNGTLMETNAQEYFSVTVNDIWILDRSGDQVVVSNPATGASAAVNVDRVEGESATFHREGLVGKNRSFQEIPTIAVHGDTLTGQSINKIIFLKNGAPVREFYAVYQLQAQRIAGARTRFQPEHEGSGPDINIEDVRSSR